MRDATAATRSSVARTAPRCARAEIRSRSSPIRDGAEFPTIPDDSILAGGEEQAGLESKIDPTGATPVNWSTEDHIKALLNFFGGSTTPAESPTGVWLHRMSNRQTSVVPGTLAMEISRDLGQPELYVGGYAKQIQMNLAPRAMLNGSIDWLFPRFHTWKTPAQSVGTPPTTTAFLRGLSKYSYLTAADGDVYVKISVAPSGGSMGIQVKVGAVGTYGSTITVAAGSWYDLSDNVDYIGDLDLPVQIKFTDLLTYALNDVLKFARERAVWTQSLATGAQLNEIAAFIYIDDVAFPVNQLAFVGNRPADRREVIGGRFIDTIDQFGERTYTVTLNRRATDLAIINRLRRGQSVSFRMDAYGPLIGSTTSRRRLSLIGKNGKLGGKTASVGGKAAFDEPINIRFHPSSDGTYPAPMTCEVVNSQSSPAS